MFRDHGRVPGLDIAFIDRGEVYHTEHDTAARIPGGSVQRAGDNVLAVLNRWEMRVTLPFVQILMQVDKTEEFGGGEPRQ